MKKYKPTYKAPTPYSQRRRFLNKRRKKRVGSAVENDFEGFVNEHADEDTALNSCSMYDCTGLIPSAVKSLAEAEAYENLYSYIAPAAGNTKETS